MATCISVCVLPRPPLLTKAADGARLVTPDSTRNQKASLGDLPGATTRCQPGADLTMCTSISGAFAQTRHPYMGCRTLEAGRVLRDNLIVDRVQAGQSIYVSGANDPGARRLVSREVY